MPPVDAARSTAFLRKVYVILSMQLGLTAGMCSLFLFVDEIREWVTDPAKYGPATVLIVRVHTTHTDRAISGAARAYVLRFCVHVWVRRRAPSARGWFGSTFCPQSSPSLP